MICHLRQVARLGGLMVTHRSNISAYDGQQEEASPSALFSAMDTATSVSMLDELGGWALSWLDRQSLPHVMLSKELTILWANAAARAALTDKRDVQSCTRTFAAVDPDHRPNLHNFLISSNSSLTSWSMPRSDGDGRVIFRAQRIEETASSIIIVTFFGSGSDFQPVYAALDNIFGLTKAQHGVLTDLLDGHDADAIAQLRKVSVETVRTHIRIIYSKIGVNSREALFHTLQPFRL